MSHHDGPVYFPVVANLSLGSHTIMNLTRIKRDPADSLVEPPIRLLLEPRSLLLLSSQACVKYALYISLVLLPKHVSPFTLRQIQQLDAWHRRIDSRHYRFICHKSSPHLCACGRPSCPASGLLASKSNSCLTDDKICSEGAGFTRMIARSAFIGLF